jgi:hypothetical protein
MTKREKGVTYLLRDVDRTIWRRARSRAVLEGRSMRDVIVDLLDKWAYDGGIVGLGEKPKSKRTK